MYCIQYCVEKINDLFIIIYLLNVVQVVSDDNLAMLVRQIALHCNLAANIYSNIQSKAVRYFFYTVFTIYGIDTVSGFRMISSRKG
jgi:hypothetical protein